MAQSVNLIPDQEVQEQTQKKVVKMSTVFSILVLIVVSGITAYFVYKTTSINSQIKDEDTKIATARSQIQAKSSIEITARNLDKKYKAIKEMLGSRPYYSTLMEEFRARTPEGIVIKNYTMLKDNKISVTGQAVTYVTITTFGNNLLTANFSGGNQKLSGVFKSIILNQVDLSQSGTVDFSMTIDYDPEKLTNGQ